MRPVRSPGVLLVLLLGAMARAEEPLLEPGAPLTFESSELHALAGTWGEPFRAVMLLPGVSHVVSGAPYPVVRGALPASTAFSLDGVRVPQLYHLGLGPSTVHPALIEGLSFHRGPAPARFGRELGGTVQARLLPAQPDIFSYAASVDLLNAGLLVQAPLPSTGTVLTLAGRFGYTPALVAAYLNGTPGAEWALNVFDYQARVTQPVGQGSLRLLALGSSDRGGLRGEGNGASGGVGFHRVDLRLTYPLPLGEAEAALTWGREGLSLEEAGGEASRLSLSLAETTVGARAAWRVAFSSDSQVELGADMERRLADVDQSTTFHPGEAGDPSRPTVTTHVFQPLARATFAGAYVQLMWRASPFQFTPGLRVDSYSLGPALTRVVVEPRLHVRWSPSERVSLRLGTGLRHQPPAHLVDIPGSDAAGLRMGLQQAFEVEAGADVRGPAGFTFAADVFVQPRLRTVELDVLAFDVLSEDAASRAPLRTATGHGYGVEFLARRALSEHWAVLASYTYQRRLLRTRVERRSETGAVLGTEVVEVASPREQSHVLNASLNVQLPWGLNAGTTLHYNTGAPEAGGLVASYTQREGVDPERGTPRWVPEDRDKVARLPGFFRVDARLSKAGWLWGMEVEAWLDVFNATLARETFRYTYGRERGALVRRPFNLPPLTLPSLGIRARH
jgi:hypothetical protein